MWERRREQKGHFVFVPGRFLLLNLDSVLAPVDAGGKPSCDDAGTFYCGWRWELSVGDADAAADAGESAGCVTRAAAGKERGRTASVLEAARSSLKDERWSWTSLLSGQE